MERRKFIKNAAGTAVVGGLMGSALPALAKEKEMVVHYVLFWLKEDLSEQQVKDFAGFFEELKKVPNVHSLHYGPAAPTHQRDVVDNSFSYNLLTIFKSMDDINVYENHPIHLAAIEKYSENWTKVIVHDSLLKM